ncbi:flagellar motor switch protein FliG [Rhodanobacter sp. ANJX3]|uniref:flagellar motor switch protein FliG n=1 Tax=unclassified Rhodanobacter TaxID=2621553 RepID=UPI0015CB5FE8|nr:MULTISPECIES: flagellar motor switch protein FliG [unclassified Rhodanobacter]MBB5359958.1 flagellar motor switch protein FliG [Rhodanobacter sp. ANJX3]NYE28878.1 flagellar motor switch protein FliG [Rhodanobacter sp. K2T2]
MAAESIDLGGAQRAAILLLTLGEQDAAEVLKHLSAREVQAVGSAMATLTNVSREQVENVLGRLNDDIGRQTSLGIGTEEYIRKMLVSALGETKAGSLIDRILLGRSAKGLESLKWMESRAIAEMIGMEHPQIIALVLAHLEPDQAAEVIGYLPTRTRSDAVMRIANLDGVQPHALNELDEIMERQFSGNSNKLKSSSVGGLKAAADILNAMETSRETELMAAIRSQDATLVGRIEELMFVFEDLADLDDRSMQALLREVPSARLVTALKGAEPAVREKIFANMSKRAADMLRDDLEVKGPVKLSEVDAAQKEVLTIARKMADAGQISLVANGDEFV